MAEPVDLTLNMLRRIDEKLIESVRTCAISRCG